jgi:hypothetical protein
MLERHVELCPHLRVAFVAKVYLFLREQVLGRGGTVNGMAVRADNVILRVLRPLDLSTVDVFSVAGEAVVQDTLRRKFAESDDGRFPAARFHVRLPGTVARLAAGFIGRFFAGRNRSIVGILVKVRPNIRVARFTD